MAIATILTQLLILKSKKNEYVLDQIINANRMERIAKSFSNQQKYCEKWEDVRDDALYGEGVKIKGVQKLEKGETATLREAETLADLACPEYDADVLYELERLDEQYDTEKAEIEAELTMLEAEIQSIEAEATKEAGVTGILGSGGGGG